MMSSSHCQGEIVLEFDSILPLISFLMSVICWCSLCTSLDWDKDGDVLAVANDKNGMFVISC